MRVERLLRGRCRLMPAYAPLASLKGKPLLSAQQPYSLAPDPTALALKMPVDFAVARTRVALTEPMQYGEKLDITLLTTAPAFARSM